MRCAIIATPALLSDLRPAPGALDGDLLRARLPLPDTDFTVFDLDPARDLAEQIDILFDEQASLSGEPVLFYASSLVVIAVDGELFLCLDPSDPKTGDSFKDIAYVLRDRINGPLLIMLECRHSPDPDNPFKSASVVEAAKDALVPGTEVELLVAAHPIAAGDEDQPSAFTRAIVEALDESEPEKGLDVRGLYEQIRDSGKLLGVVPSFTHVRASTSFQLVDAQEPILLEKPRTTEPEEAEPGEAQASSESAEAPEQEDGAAEEPSAEAEATAPAEEGDEAPAAAETDETQEEPAAASKEEEEARSSIEPVPISELIPISMIPESVSQFTESSPSDSLPAVAAANTDAQPAPVSARTHERNIAAMEATTSVPVIFDMTAPVPASFEATQSVNVIFETTDQVVAEAAEPTFADVLALGDRLAAEDKTEDALTEYKKALGMLAVDATKYRAEVFVRIAGLKMKQGKHREAIATYEKAIAALPTHRKALEALIDATVAEQDWRGLQAAEEKLFSALTDNDELFKCLIASADRWGGVVLDAQRARELLERARELKPANSVVIDKLHRLYLALELPEEALALRRKAAEVTDDPRERALKYMELARYCLDELGREALAVELFDAALDSDPTYLEPLAVLERMYEERREWSEVEQLYRRMLERLELTPKGKARREATWDVSRRLAFLCRDHLDDKQAALSAFEEAIAQKPTDLDSHCFAVELSRMTGHLDGAVSHLQAIAALDPANAQNFHDLFELFQKLRKPDQAYAAACAAVFLKSADTRERIIFEEHAVETVPAFVHPLPEGAWDLLREGDTDPHVEAILSAVSSAAVAAKIAILEEEKRLPYLDPDMREKPEESAIEIVRSFAWGSRYLGIPAPFAYVREDASIGLAAVMAPEPSVIVGSHVLRGRSPGELAFMVGRHLAYHLGSHRLLLYYPSLDDLSVCFLAALRVALKTLPVPAKLRDSVLTLVPRIESKLSETEIKKLQQAVAKLDASGAAADITKWVGGVEHCAVRAGFLLCGDLGVADAVLKADPLGMITSEDKIAGLLGFIVSDAYHKLRTHLGIAIEP